MSKDLRKITVRNPCACIESRVVRPLLIYGERTYPKKQRCITCGGWLDGERLQWVQEQALSNGWGNRKP